MSRLAHSRNGLYTAQMGTSIGMIERHYSHLTPRLKKDMLTGKRYELSRDEFADQHDTREL